MTMIGVKSEISAGFEEALIFGASNRRSDTYHKNCLTVFEIPVVPRKIRAWGWSWSAAVRGLLEIPDDVAGGRCLGRGSQIQENQQRGAKDAEEDEGSAAAGDAVFSAQQEQAGDGDDEQGGAEQVGVPGPPAAGVVMEGMEGVESGIFSVARGAAWGSIPGVKISPTQIGRIRQCGRIEGISYLLLLGVAMPLKYLAGQPLMVTWVGWAHGVLFIGYCLLLAVAFFTRRLSFWKSLLAFVAALLPFGPFVLDRHLESAEQAEREALAAAGKGPSPAAG